MAETNLASSATNSDCNAPSPNVPSDADLAREGLSRRNLMQLATSAAAVPALTFLPTTPAVATSVGRSKWEKALANYRRTNAEYDRICSAEEAAQDAAYEAVEHDDRFFDDYQLHVGMKREDVVQCARHACAKRAGYTGWVLYPANKRLLSEQQAAAIKLEADRIADEFMIYQTHIEEARRLHHVDEWGRRVKAYMPRYFEARDALMEVPAPDAPALLVKMEIAAESLSNSHSESVLADGRRLLSGGKA